MKPMFSLALLSAALFAACGGEPKDDSPSGTHTHADGTVHQNDPAADERVHGEEFALGEVQLAGYTILVTQAGKVEAGKEAAFDLAFAEGLAMPGTVRAWIGIESAKGSMKMKLEKEGDAGMHAHIETPSPIPAGSKLWIEIEEDAGNSKAALAFR